MVSVGVYDDLDILFDTDKINDVLMDIINKFVTITIDESIRNSSFFKCKNILLLSKYRYNDVLSPIDLRFLHKIINICLSQIELCELLSYSETPGFRNFSSRDFSPFLFTISEAIKPLRETTTSKSLNYIPALYSLNKERYCYLYSYNQDRKILNEEIPNVGHNTKSASK